MEASRYNHFAWCDDAGIAFNARTGRSFFVGGDLLKEVVDFLNQTPLAEASSSLSPGMLSRLRAFGFVVESRDAEFAEIIEEDRIDRTDKSRLSLTILPTLQCNMGCAYCYQERLTDKNLDKKEAEFLSFVETFLNENSVSVLDVSWYGGEPIMGLKNIRKLTPILRSMADLYGAEYRASIITNGSLITPKLADELAGLSVVHAQVTFDGDENFHQQRRFYKSRRGSSFYASVDGVENLLRRMNVTIRLNVDGNNARSALNFLDFANEKGWLSGDLPLDIYVSPLERINSVSEVTEYDILSRARFSHLETEFSQKLESLSGKARQRLPEPLGSICSVVRDWAFVVNPDFGISKCWNDTGMKKSDTQVWHHSIEDDPDCAECEVMPLCKGGCPYHRRADHVKREDYCISDKFNLHEKLIDALKLEQKKNARELMGSIEDCFEDIVFDAELCEAAIGSKHYEYWPIQKTLTA